MNNKSKRNYNKYDIGGSLNQNDLLNQFSQTSLASTNNKAEDFNKTSSGDITNSLLNTAGAVGKFATGDILGGVMDSIQALSGVGGIIGNSITAKKEADETNRKNKLLNDAQINNFSNLAANNQNAMFNKSLLNISANGGPLQTNGTVFESGVTEINNGGTHEQNRNGGVQYGVDNNNVPNLVEQGEVVYGNFVFSDRIKVPNKNTTFAQEAKKLSKESRERPNDPISERSLNSQLQKLSILQESVKQQQGLIKNNSNTYLNGTPELEVKKPGWQTYLRYAPALGSLIGSGLDLFGVTNKPDYSQADLIEKESRNIPIVDYKPIGNYVDYKPLDRNYYTNQLRSQSAATRNAIQNQAINSSSAIAGLLNADYNAQVGLGNLFRQAEEYNRNQQLQTEQFNRGTNMTNSQMALQSDMANLEAFKPKLQGIMNAAQLRAQQDALASQGRTANLTGIFDNLGNIGTEEYRGFIIDNAPYLDYDRLGNYKGQQSSNGGKINTKNKRRGK